jgi:HSP20 family protein
MPFIMLQKSNYFYIAGVLSTPIMHNSRGSNFLTPLTFKTYTIMAHAKHPFSPSVRGPYLPSLKEPPLTAYFDYDRFFHLPWGHAFPPVNVKENDKSFDIELMAPGFDKKDLNISIDEGFLTVSVESKHEDEKKENDYTKREFGSSSFSRSFHIPVNANEEDIQAKYENGVLKLVIAKKNISATKPKKSIEVK